MEMIKLKDKYDILNGDISLCNFLVFQRPEEEVRIYVIDFGFCVRKSERLGLLEEARGRII